MIIIRIITACRYITHLVMAFHWNSWETICSGGHLRRTSSLSSRWRTNDDRSPDPEHHLSRTSCDKNYPSVFHGLVQQRTQDSCSEKASGYIVAIDFSWIELAAMAAAKPHARALDARLLPACMQLVWSFTKLHASLAVFRTVWKYSCAINSPCNNVS